MTASRAIAPASAMAAPAHPFEALFKSPQFRAQRAERERRDASTRAEALVEHGSEDAVFADTPMEAALRAACEPLREPGTAWTDLYKLAGWYWLDGRDRMPETLRAAVSEAWPLPETVAAAWVEREAVGRRNSQRYAFDEDWSPHGFAEARAAVVDALLDTMPARSLADLRARLDRLEEVNDMGAPHQGDQRIRLATLRADIERMAMRLRASGAERVERQP